MHVSDANPLDVSPERFLLWHLKRFFYVLTLYSFSGGSDALERLVIIRIVLMYANHYH